MKKAEKTIHPYIVMASVEKLEQIRYSFKGDKEIEKKIKELKELIAIHY